MKKKHVPKAGFCFLIPVFLCCRRLGLFLDDNGVLCTSVPFWAEEFCEKNCHIKIWVYKDLSNEDKGL